jgi:hypothetical protein
LHLVGVPEVLHRARVAPGPEVGPVTVDRAENDGGRLAAIRLERGERHVPGRRKRSEVAAASGILLVAARGRRRGVWHVSSSVTGYDH